MGKRKADLTSDYRREPWGCPGLEVRFVRTCTYHALDGEGASRRVREDWALRSARGTIATGDRMALWDLVEANGWAVTDPGPTSTPPTDKSTTEIGEAGIED